MPARASIHRIDVFRLPIAKHQCRPIRHIHRHGRAARVPRRKRGPRLGKDRQLTGLYLGIRPQRAIPGAGGCPVFHSSRRLRRHIGADEEFVAPLQPDPVSKVASFKPPLVPAQLLFDHPGRAAESRHQIARIDPAAGDLVPHTVTFLPTR